MYLEPIQDYTDIIHFFFTTILIIIFLCIVFLIYLVTGIYYLIKYYSEVNLCLEKDIWYYILVSLIIQFYFFLSLTSFFQIKRFNFITINIILSVTGILFGIFELIKNESQCNNLYSMHLWKFGIGVFIIYFIYFILHTILYHNID